MDWTMRKLEWVPTVDTDNTTMARVTQAIIRHLEWINTEPNVSKYLEDSEYCDELSLVRIKDGAAVFQLMESS